MDTGVALARLFGECRMEAEAQARARNEAFERAKRAYLSRDAGGAKSFSAQGRELDVRMKAAHKDAAARIFTQRGGGSKGLVEVPLPGGEVLRVMCWDLHGLFAGEAAPLVEESLERVRGGEGGGVKWVALLTGARNHSTSLGKGGGSLSQGVEDSLVALGYVVVCPTPGVLVVKLD